MYWKKYYYCLFTICVCVTGYVYGLPLADFTDNRSKQSLLRNRSCIFQVTKTVTQYMLNTTKTWTG